MRECLTSKLFDEIIKRPLQSHETIPLTLLSSSIILILFRSLETMTAMAQFVLQAMEKYEKLNTAEQH
jgi:hypothetical protein